MTDTALPAEAPPRAAAKRHSTVGLVLVGFWVLLGIGILLMLFSSISSDRLTLYGPRILEGLSTTVQLCVLSLLIGAAISIPIAAGLRSRKPFWRALAFCYSYFFRGTPLIAQVFLVYYGAGEFSSVLKSVDLWWIFRSAYGCAIIAFSLNTAAYQAEILAGAISAVPSGQREAAKALALSGAVTMRKIIMPQALITALRPYGNEIILMVKASAIASIITVLDLMGETKHAFAQTYDLSLYLWAAVFYLGIVEALRRIWNGLERHLTRHIKTV